MNMSVCITITEKVSVVNSVKLQYCGCFLSSFNPSSDFRSRQREVFFLKTGVGLLTKMNGFAHFWCLIVVIIIVAVLEFPISNIISKLDN